MGSSLRNAMLSLALVLVAGASLPAHASGASNAAGMNTIDYGEALHIGDEAARQWNARQPVATSVQVQLQAAGVSDAETAKVLAAIDRRAGAELRHFATTLEGRSFTADELRTTMAARERVIRFNAQCSPRAFAAGRPLPYVVSEAEAARLARGFAATWIERQAPLREKVREMVTLEDIGADDVAPLQSYARELAVGHARERLASMRGAAFFSADDAQRFLEEAFDEKIDEIRVQKLGEPGDRASFLDEARAHYAMGNGDSDS